MGQPHRLLPLLVGSPGRWPWGLQPKLLGKAEATSRGVHITRLLKIGEKFMCLKGLAHRRYKRNPYSFCFTHIAI